MHWSGLLLPIRAVHRLCPSPESCPSDVPILSRNVSQYEPGKIALEGLTRIGIWEDLAGSPHMSYQVSCCDRYYLVFLFTMQGRSTSSRMPRGPAVISPCAWNSHPAMASRSVCLMTILGMRTCLSSNNLPSQLLPAVPAAITTPLLTAVKCPHRARGGAAELLDRHAVHHVHVVRTSPQG